MKKDTNYSKLLKKRVLVILFLLILGLLIVAVSFLLYHETKFLKNIENSFNQSLNKVVEHIIQKDIINSYLFRANNILNTPNVKKFLKEKNRKELHKVILPFWQKMTKKNSYLKIMVFHSPDGTAFLRMHKPEIFGDNLSNVREMVQAIHQNKKLLVGYETGKFNTVYRVIVPIFENNQYLGALDFGINPNHFIDTLNSITGGNGALFVNKQDLKLFKRDINFSIGEYQLQSIVDDKTLSLLKYIRKNCNSILRDDYECKINDKYYIVHIKNVKDFKNKTKAKLLFFQDITEYKKFYNTAIIYIIGSAIILLIAIFIMLNYSFNYFIEKLQKLHNISMKKEIESKKELIFKEKYSKTILNSNENIIITTLGGEELYSANDMFLKFFNYKNIEEFKKEHECICDFFETKKNYITKEINGKNWLDYILENRDKTHKVLIKRNNNNYIFKVNASLMEFDEKARSVVNFTDITKIEEYKNNLEERVKSEIEKRRKQEQLLIQQSKMSSIVEMMSSIAHQWRQPLNIISSSIQNLSIHVELGEEIKSKDIIEINDRIMKQVGYMSKTIDDFRNFFKPSKEKIEFDIKNSILNLISLTKAQLNDKSIHIDFKFNEKDNFLILGYQSEFEHILLNIISNAKDAIENRIQNSTIKKDINGLIKIDLICSNSKVVIKVIDNGGGIKDEIIDKIFEPYFTTKFESMGTGIGLYMAKIIVEKNMGGKIYAQNFEDGSKFTIEISK